MALLMLSSPVLTRLNSGSSGRPPPVTTGRCFIPAPITAAKQARPSVATRTPGSIFAAAYKVIDYTSEVAFFLFRAAQSRPRPSALGVVDGGRACAGLGRNREKARAARRPHRGCQGCDH